MEVSYSKFVDIKGLTLNLRFILPCMRVEKNNFPFAVEMMPIKMTFMEETACAWFFLLSSIN